MNNNQSYLLARRYLPGGGKQFLCLVLESNAVTEVLNEREFRARYGAATFALVLDDFPFGLFDTLIERHRPETDQDHWY